ncbi:hypothetical protein CWI38_0127p0030 [Hamiltosporidium tvaerminnensis]|uniref:Uncharacterized protein n=1 Tax=Hamiltosporidium tvaerminnensis TaxID=1176355 RepID=A0A4Q9M0M9_9MICR|nr:hypothetical protein CWI37_0196p0030 [Hamiltosporidium tvaerminnensis]TBU20135.1 hypothetical protein CWI38_0127p0030 [Hamiltosporidium tvaerminnensis]
MDQFSKITNGELERIKRFMIISRIQYCHCKKRRLGWLGHVERMFTERAAGKIFKAIPEGKRTRGGPRKRWLDNVEEDLMKLDVIQKEVRSKIENNGEVSFKRLGLF